jgi:hypothetical protein
LAAVFVAVFATGLVAGLAGLLAVVFVAVLAAAAFAGAALAVGAFAPALAVSLDLVSETDFLAAGAGAFLTAGLGGVVDLAAGLAVALDFVSGTALTGRAAFLAGGVTGVVAVRRAALVAGTGVDVLGVVTGDTDDLPGRWRDLSGGANAAVQGTPKGSGACPSGGKVPLPEQIPTIVARERVDGGHCPLSREC